MPYRHRFLVLLGALLLIASKVFAAQPHKSVCPPGQVSIVHVISEGRLTYNMYVAVPQKVFPHLGIDRVEEWLGPDGYSKSATSTTYAEADDAGSIVWAYVRYREVQSRNVVLRFGANIYEYDELSGKPGKRRVLSGLSPASEIGESGVLMSGAGELIMQSPVISKARYAGIDCNVYALPNFIANSRNGRSCVAQLQGHHVVLAQDWVDGQTRIPQTMHATLVEVGKCVAETEFRPPLGIKFTSESPTSAKIKFRSGDEVDESGN